MKRTILKTAGIVVFLFTILSNIQNAFLGYGFENVSFGTVLLAQTSSAGVPTNCQKGYIKYNCVRTSDLRGMFTTTRCGSCTLVFYNTYEATGECYVCKE